MEVAANNVIPYNNLGYIYLEKDKQKAAEYLFKTIEVDSRYLYIYQFDSAIHKY
ncbi:MAG: Flp pilus assembly protein TadD [Flavobacterium sp.]|jgi:Flp pilus assembly protein TadD